MLSFQNKTTKTNTHICSWLKLTRIFDDIIDIDDYQLLQECVKNVASIIGYRRSLYLLANTASNEETNKMIQSVSALKSNHKLLSSKEMNDEDIDNSNEINLNFCKLSDDSIINICEYLNKNDMKLFKQTSKQIAIICLNQYIKIPIKVFNANRFITDHHHKLSLIDLIAGKPYSTKRYNPNIPCYRLFEEWSKTYHISEENQLIIMYESGKLMILDSKCLYLKPIHILLQYPSNNASFIVVDKSKIMILNGFESRTMNIKQDTTDNLENHRFTIFQYFDTINQIHQIIHFVLFHKDMTYKMILNYIQNGYHCFDGINNKWHQELILILKQINNDSNHRKLAIYRHEMAEQCTKIVNINDCMHCDSFYSLQINPNHPWFSKTDKFDRYKYNEYGFCFDVIDYFNFKQKLSIVMEYGDIDSPQNLRKSVKYYYYEQLNEEEKKKYDLNIIMRDINDLRIIEFEDEFNEYNLSGLIRMKLSQKFKNMIPSQHFEIFSSLSTTTTRLSYFESLGNLKKNEELFFEIVDYDTKIIMDDERVYRVDIYGHEQCPRPYIQYKDKRNYIQTQSIMIKYKQQFIVKDFVKDLMLRNQQRFDEYLDDNNNNEIDTNFRYILIEIDNLYIDDKNTYKMNEEYKNVSNNKIILDFRLYLFRTGCNDKNKMKLSIRFDAYSQFNINMKWSEVDKMEYVGFPLIVWIDKNDILCNVFEQYLNEKIRSCIKNIYKVSKKDNSKIVLIEKTMITNYKPFVEFLKDNPTDFIVITLQSRDLPPMDIFPRCVNTDF